MEDLYGIFTCGKINENINPCPAELGFIYFENTVDPDQLASDKAI